MPPKGTKRKPRAAMGDDDDLWDVPRDQPTKRTRVSGPRTSESRIDEDVENSGQKATKQFQSWAEWQKRFNAKEKEDKRNFAMTFKQNIEKKRETIQRIISKSSENLSGAGKEQTDLFKATCAEIEAAPTLTLTSENGSPKCRQDSPLFHLGQELFKKCRDLVDIHEQANSKTSAQGHTHTNETRTLWKADMEQAQKAILYGAQYGEKIIRYNVDMYSNEDTKMQLLTPPRNTLNKTGQMALDMHQGSKAKLSRGEPTWGDEALKYMDKFIGMAAICELQTEDM